MAKFEFNLHKMHTELTGPVQYSFNIDGDEKLLLNDFIGKSLQLKFLGEIACIQCGRKTNKSFQQGYCFPCMRDLQDCNLCMIHPEKCRFYEGSCDPNHWVHAGCGKSQIIYLSNTSALKIGITRETQVPTRWIDQGANQAIPIMKVSNRYQSGIVEVAFKEFVYDKTNWRAMLKSDAAVIDMEAEKERLMHEVKDKLADILQQYPADEIEVLNAAAVQINYPVQQYPEKITSFNFDKNPVVEGTLQGIKGQYLIFDTGVINIRKFGGYRVSLAADFSPS